MGAADKYSDEGKFEGRPSLIEWWGICGLVDGAVETDTRRISDDKADDILRRAREQQQKRQAE